MNVARLFAVRNVFQITCTALAVMVCFHSKGDSLEGEPGFQKSKYPRIQVRHTPVPKTDKSRQVPAQGTPRTELPVLNARGPKGGKMVRLDNTYLVQCPPPGTVPSTNASVEVKAR